MDDIYLVCTYQTNYLILNVIFLKYSTHPFVLNNKLHLVHIDDKVC